MRYVHPDNATTRKTKNDSVGNLIAISYHEGIVNNAAYVFQIILLHQILYPEIGGASDCPTPEVRTAAMFALFMIRN
jgi:hypothetical protein